MFENVLVGVDGSRAAAMRSRSRKRLLAEDGKLTLVHAIAGRAHPLRADHAGDCLREERAAAEKLLEGERERRGGAKAGSSAPWRPRRGRDPAQPGRRRRAPT